MNQRRYVLLDTIRGFSLVSMILYHAIWDIVYIFGVDMPWYKSQMAYIWQQSICQTFILLSGFCWHFGRRKLKRGLIVFGCSVVISLVTIFFMPDSLILFGVLSLIGSAMLVMIPLDKILKKANPYVGAVVCLLLFLLTKSINSGTIGLGNLFSITISDALYTNMFTAYLGFPPEDFFSCDYFGIFPWIFLFQTGYFLYYCLQKKQLLEKLPDISILPLAWLGRHSLVAYMLHQPVVYGVLFFVFG